VHVLDGEFAPTVFPIVPGHETSGVVVGVGKEVSNVAPGDPVSLDPSFYCGDCSYCMVGRGNLCENWDGAGVVRSTALPPSWSARQPRTCIDCRVLLILLWPH
jgi:D-arabinose 1-dehydrogenase-like Zn-dependent alcohol dehydrogenase